MCKKLYLYLLLGFLTMVLLALTSLWCPTKLCIGSPEMDSGVVGVTPRSANSIISSRTIMVRNP